MFSVNYILCHFLLLSCQPEQDRIKHMKEYDHDIVSFWSRYIAELANKPKLKRKVWLEINFIFTVTYHTAE
jgi:hypothetical protein